MGVLPHLAEISHKKMFSSEMHPSDFRAIYVAKQVTLLREIIGEAEKTALHY